MEQHQTNDFQCATGLLSGMAYGEECLVETEAVFDSGPDLLKKRYDHCEKNPGHQSFYRVSELSMDILPERMKTPESLQLIKTKCDLTVRIKVKYTSERRPDKFADGKIDYPFYKQKGKSRLIRNGTGTINRVMKSENTKLPCPCQQCAVSCTPHKTYYPVSVCTATHVIFDDLEARDATVECFFNSDDRKGVKLLYGVCLELLSTSPTDMYTSDICQLICVTHDKETTIKITSLLNSTGLVGGIPHVHTMTFPPEGVIVSHPHGCSKRISFGEVRYVTVPVQPKYRTCLPTQLPIATKCRFSFSLSNNQEPVKEPVGCKSASKSKTSHPDAYLEMIRLLDKAAMEDGTLPIYRLAKDDSISPEIMTHVIDGVSKWRDKCLAGNFDISIDGDEGDRLMLKYVNDHVNLIKTFYKYDFTSSRTNLSLSRFAELSIANLKSKMGSEQDYRDLSLRGDDEGVQEARYLDSMILEHEGLPAMYHWTTPADIQQSEWETWAWQAYGDHNGRSRDSNTVGVSCRKVNQVENTIQFASNAQNQELEKNEKNFISVEFEARQNALSDRRAISAVEAVTLNKDKGKETKSGSNANNILILLRNAITALKSLPEAFKHVMTNVRVSHVIRNILKALEEIPIIFRKMITAFRRRIFISLLRNPPTAMKNTPIVFRFLFASLAITAFSIILILLKSMVLVVLNRIDKANKANLVFDKETEDYLRQEIFQFMKDLTERHLRDKTNPIFRTFATKSANAVEELFNSIKPGRKCLEEDFYLPFATSFILPAGAPFAMRCYKHSPGWFSFPTGTVLITSNGTRVPIALGTEFKSALFAPQFSVVTHDIPTCPGSSGATIYCDFFGFGVVSLYPHFGASYYVGNRMANRSGVQENKLIATNFIATDAMLKAEARSMFSDLMEELRNRRL